MPELPEVETVKRGLKPFLEGAEIKNVLINRPDLRWPFPFRMRQRLEGKKILSLRRRSKYLLIDLSSEETLLIHLGMSGRLFLSKRNTARFVYEKPSNQKHDHVLFYLDNSYCITFNDPRRFGAMDLFSTEKADEHNLLKRLGPEPQDKNCETNLFFRKIKNKKSPIKSVLLNQEIVSGLGNIYVCESLFRAGIAPNSLACSLSIYKLKILFTHIRKILLEAIDAGGSTLKDFRNSDGELGYFQFNFNVYGREGAQCRKKNCRKNIKRVVQSGRSTFYCPRCQR